MNFRDAINVLKDDTLPLEKVKTILDSIQDKIIAPILDLDNRYYISRGVDYFSDPDQIQNVKDLYYPPAEKVTTFGRANLPGKPMFYGILPTQETPITIGACLTECSEKLRKPLAEGKFHACIGRWEVKEGEIISLFSIINPHGEQNNSFLSGLNSDYKAFASAKKDEISIEDNYLLHKFLYEQFNREGNERNYWISAIISDNLIKAGVDGILYESVQGKNIGYNNTVCVAISPKAADRKLKFLDYAYVTSNYYFPDNGEGLQLKISEPCHF